MTIEEFVERIEGQIADLQGEHAVMCGRPADLTEWSLDIKVTDLQALLEAFRAEQAEREAAQSENTRIRAALANSQGACVYCSMSAEDWAKCQHGFPGCDRADDAMGCPYLGSAMDLQVAQARIAELEKELLDYKGKLAFVKGAHDEIYRGPHASKMRLRELKARIAELEQRLAAAPSVPEDLRKASEAATPGEWAVSTGYSDAGAYFTGIDAESGEVCGEFGPPGDRDTDFIIAAVNFVRSLIAAQPAPAPVQETKS